MPASDQGLSKTRYVLVPRTLVFLFRGRQVLLICGHPNKKIWANRYNGIGGHVERGEDALRAARRELFEETGLSGISLSLCGQISIDVEVEAGVCLFIFWGELPKSETHLLRNSPEGNLEWVSLDELGQKELVEDVPLLIPKVLASRQTSQIFFGCYSYDTGGKLEINFEDTTSA